MEKTRQNMFSKIDPMTSGNKKMLQEMCAESDVNYEIIHSLLEVVRNYAFMERRKGIYEDIIEIIDSD